MDLNIVSYWWVLLILIPLFCYKLVLRFFGVIIIPNNRVGIVTKKFVVAGANRTLPDGALIAMKGEAGIQADTLAPGLHIALWPWQYDVNMVPFVTVEEGKVGVVEARDGHPMTNGKVLGRQVECDSYQSARQFLTSNGERGPQIAVIPPGTYRINTSLFTVVSEDALEIEDNKVGIVTTKEGTPLPTGEIAGHEVAGHNMYQDGQSFVDKGGYKGLQEQVLLAGRYYLNPRFATVEIVDMTEVPIAHAGVVIAYVGAAGVDVTGDSFKHGNLVKKGQKGVWVEPLDPGRYPINPRTHRVENVPTANVVLNWATGKTEAHKLDEKLCTITVRSSDGFKFNLDVSQIIHIPRNDAPKVIARFGSMINLVTQVLEPTIGNYFRNAAQGSDVIDFLKKRSEKQQDAKKSISDALTEYNVGAVDTLIGDIVPPDDLMKTLTDRKLAEQEQVTYETQRQAEGVRKDLQQARALADTQAKVVDAERTVTIAEFNAQAAIKNAEGQAKSKTTIAEADAMVVRTVGKAEGEKTLAVGSAEADVIKLKVNAMDAAKFASVEIAKALAHSGFRLVPDIMVSGGGEGSGKGGTLVDVLLANLVKDQVAKAQQEPAKKPATTETPAPKA
jgi:uncharacterized membrane protein YqiK